MHAPLSALRTGLAAAAVLFTFCTGALAQEAAIRKNLPERLPNLPKIDEVRTTPMAGLYEIRVNGSEIYYTDAQGTYLIQGNLIDTKARRNLTEERVEKLNAINFDSLPLKDAFVMTRGDGKRKIAVFEDPNCGYCKRFERDLQKVDNVTVYLFLYPILGATRSRNPRRSGAPAARPRPGRTGWCATSRRRPPAATPRPSPAMSSSAANTRSRAPPPSFCRWHPGTRRHQCTADREIPRRCQGGRSQALSHSLRAPPCQGSASATANLFHSMPRTPRPVDGPHYRIEVDDLHAHLFRVTLTVPEPAAGQRVSLPVWIPGSYLVREFARNLQQLEARQGRKAVALHQLDKNTWDTAAQPGKPLVLRYRVYANDNSVRSAWLDTARGFFNGTSLCLRVHGQEDRTHRMALAPGHTPAGWQVATGLAAVAVDKAGFGDYEAPDYDALVDCPVEMGDFWSAGFDAGGIPHRLVVAGAAPGFDGTRLLADTRTICETAIRFWHGRSKPPHATYVFLLNVVDDNYGGLEHRNSTALICSRRDLPRQGDTRTSEGYTTLQGLISHEYFHTWNVKRLRPADFRRYHYDAEQYTRLLWFFEGFTSYYDDLLLRRAGLLDNAGYLKLLNKTINQVQQAPGRALQSVAQASMDAWIRYYRPDENTPNATISYYAKGALVALCLDLTLRREGRTTLDAVMRGLWQRCSGGPMTEDDVRTVLADLGGRSFDAEIIAWVHGTGELPVVELLQQHGAAAHQDPSQLAQRLGLRVSEAAGVQIKVVLRGGAAEKAGFSAGDEWLGVELPPAGKKKGTAAPPAGWRIQRLDDLLLYAGTATRMTALVARDRRLLRLPLVLPPADAERTLRLAVDNAQALDAWLAPPAPAGPLIALFVALVLAAHGMVLGCWPASGTHHPRCARWPHRC